MRIKASISKGFNLARSSMNVVLLLFVVGAIWSSLNAYFGPTFEQEQVAPENLGLALGIAAAGLVYMLVQVYLQGGLMGYAQASIKNGRATMADLTASGKKYFGKLLGLGILIALIVVVLIAIASMFVLLPEAVRVVAIIIALFIAAVAIAFSFLIFLAPYAIVNEGLGVRASLKRSMALVKANMGEILLMLLSIVAISIVAGLILGGLAALISLALPGERAQAIVVGILGSAVNAFLGVLVTTAFTNYYLEVSK
ncbi:MAG: hypothetical protein IPJ01_12665 [Micavibrio sp.]|nr:hypothetical protein [Micavibrio sp.]